MRAFREDEWNSFRRVDSSGDHHGLALTDGRQEGVCVLRSSISDPRWESSHSSSSKACLVGRAGGGGILVSLRRGSRLGQSVLTQFGAGGGGQVIWCANLIEIGTWSDPVEGRSVAHS